MRQKPYTSNFSINFTAGVTEVGGGCFSQTHLDFTFLFYFSFLARYQLFSIKDVTQFVQKRMAVYHN